MPRLIAFLRAINVGGHTVTMAELRRQFEAVGLQDVETFIASGNVIFTSRSTDRGALEKKIEARPKRSDSTFSNANFEKAVKAATFRGINTVVRLPATYGSS